MPQIRRHAIAPILSLALAWMAGSTRGAAVGPELLFEDLFETSAASFDANFEHESRQSGSIAPSAYAVRTPSAAQVEVNASGAPGALTLRPAPGQDFVAVSPLHSFTEGGRFTIEFEVDAGANDPDGASDDWAAITFGATVRNVFVNGTDGMGILFRNNGQIQVFNGTAAIYGGTGDYPGGAGLPKGAIAVRIEVDATGFDGSPAVVSLFVDDNPVRIAEGESLSYTKAGGFRGNAITLQGYGGGGAWDHVFDNFSVTAIPCITVSPSVAFAVSGQAGDEVTLVVPSQLTAGAAAEVVISSDDPAVAVPAGANATGELTLTMPAGTTTAAFAVEGRGAGRTTFRVASAEACVLGAVEVLVTGVTFAEVLLLDNFDPATGSLDVNVDLETRQSGVLAPVPYTEPAATAAGGAADEFTQVSWIDIGKLSIVEANVSPAHNFVEGSEFSIEFKVLPGINAFTLDSADWAAIVFGASNPNQFVISQDGMGILFRVNGLIEVWDGPARVHGSSAETAFPWQELSVRIDVRASGFDGSPAEIRMSVDGNPVNLTPDGEVYIKQGGMHGNFISLLGIGMELAHTFDDLKVSAMSGVSFDQARIEFGPGDEFLEVTVRVPAELIASGPVSVDVVSQNPGVAVPEGAVDGRLALEFSQGGATAQTVRIQAAGGGMTVLELQTAADVAIVGSLEVQVRKALVVNPSFEANATGAWPGYSPISDWQGPSGLNNATGPFHDNSTIPDRTQVAFIQGTGTLQQTINGLEPGELYWLQFYYNVRNCCGGTMDLAVRIGDEEAALYPSIPAATSRPYHFAQVPFTAPSESAPLQFVTTAAGDASVLLDAVTIVKRGANDVLVRNPSFEASGTPAWPGYATGQSIAGWVTEGQYGINASGAGPFADNGTTSDQDRAAFLQGPGAIRQSISGLVPGESYVLRYSYNARSGNQPHLRVRLGGAVVQDEAVTPVGGSAPYHVMTATVVAEGATVELSFEQTAEGDQTVLLDDVSVQGTTSDLPCITVNPVIVGITVGELAGPFTVVIPEALNASSSATVTVTSLNPEIALPAGSTGGTLALVFEAGAAASQSFEIQTLQAGTARFELSNAHGVCLETAIIEVRTSGSIVQNPSFEANPRPVGVGYGSIDNWNTTGGSGLNSSDGPFHDNGLIPDRGQVALVQGTQTLSQRIGGLVPGETYWLQFAYNYRNCCGGSIELHVSISGEELLFISGEPPVGAGNPYYVSVRRPFSPSSSSALLEFSAIAAGDATLLLDAVTVTRMNTPFDPVINSSFEASGDPAWPGYIQPASMFGWAATGNYGVNVSGAGPFADNGTNPDQGRVAFLQGPGASLTQVIRPLEGLEAGREYTLAFSYNARSGNQPQIQVLIDGAEVRNETVTPVGGMNPYRRAFQGFTAQSDAVEVSFAQVAEGDHTLLLDDIQLLQGAPPVEVALTAQFSNGMVRMSWPAAAADQGFALVTASSVSGPWSAFTGAIVPEGAQLTVTVDPTGTARFFQLEKQ